MCCEFLVGFCKNVLHVENTQQIIENCYQLRNLTDNYTVYPAILVLATLLFFSQTNQKIIPSVVAKNEQVLCCLLILATQVENNVELESLSEIAAGMLLIISKHSKEVLSK